MGWDINLAQLMPNGMWPIVDQLTTQTDDGLPSANAARDCGNAITCGMAKFVMDLTINPDWVSDIILGPEKIGVLNETQIIAFNAGRLGIPCTAYYPEDMGTAMAIVRNHILDSRPLYVLRYFQTLGAADGHWNAVFGGNGPDLYHTAQVYTCDPYPGYARVESNTTFWDWMFPYPSASQRCLIGVDRYRSVYTTAGMS